MDGVPCPPVCFWDGLFYIPVGFSFMHPGITLLTLWMWHTGIISIKVTHWFKPPWNLHSFKSFYC